MTDRGHKGPEMKIAEVLDYAKNDLKTVYGL